MCLNLITTFPKATIIFITPIHSVNASLYPNKQLKYYDDYVDAVIKCAKWFSFPIIDMYGTGSFYMDDSVQYNTYSYDGLHPNELGHKIIADVIYEALDKISRKATSL